MAASPAASTEAIAKKRRAVADCLTDEDYGCFILSDALDTRKKPKVKCTKCLVEIRGEESDMKSHMAGKKHQRKIMVDKKQSKLAMQKRVPSDTSHTSAHLSMQRLVTHLAAEGLPLSRCYKLFTPKLIEVCLSSLNWMPSLLM